MKKLDEPFVLSSGHAGLALYVILEDFYSRENGFYGINAVDLFHKHGVHPNRDMENGIYCSGGSLGHGLPIAVGMALADRTRNVYCLVSDGEIAEGSIWEALNIARNYKLTNLRVYLNYNGYSAYDKVELEPLLNKLRGFGFPVKVFKARETNYDFLKGLDAHYYTMDEMDYKSL
jgi:transketolase